MARELARSARGLGRSPSILPPAILIVIALVVFYIFELIAWAILGTVAWIRTTFLKRTDVKQVNQPHPAWKL